MKEYVECYERFGYVLEVQLTYSYSAVFEAYGITFGLKLRPAFLLIGISFETSSEEVLEQLNETSGTFCVSIRPINILGVAKDFHK